MNCVPHRIIQAALFSLISLMTIPALAATGTDAYIRLSSVEQQLETLAIQRANIRKTLNSQVNFDKQASTWFGKFKKVNSEINTVKNHPNTTYKGQNKQTLLNSLNAKRDNLRNLNGGTYIGGQHFSSMQQLESTFKSMNQDVKDTNKDYREVLRKINALEKQRLSINKELVDQAVKTSKEDRQELARLEKNRPHIMAILNQEDIWYVDDVVETDAPYMHKERAIQVLSENFMEEIIVKGIKPGTEEFNKKSEELFAMVKNLDKFNKYYKDEVRKKVKLMDQRIAELRQRVKLAEKKPVDITGNWVLLLPGSNDNPHVLIVDEGNGTYAGYLSHVGNLIKPYLRNHRLFRVHRTSDQSFGGTEYSFNAEKQLLNVQLTLTVDKSAQSMTYRSDATYQMQKYRAQ